MKATFVILLYIFPVTANLGHVHLSAVLPAQTKRENIDLSLLVDGTKEVACGKWSTSSDTVTFSCEVDSGGHSILVRCHVPGYKLYLINIPHLQVVPLKTTEVQLGNIQLTDANEPRIEQIVRTEAKDGSIRYQITVHNLSKKTILITGFGVHGGHREHCWADLNHFVYYFEISKELKLSFLGKDNAQIKGEIANLDDHPEFLAEVRGTALAKSCGLSRISLSAPVTLELPADDYLELQLIIPKSKIHSLTPPGGEDAATHFYGPSQLIEIPTVEVFQMFRNLCFVLTTSNKDWREIKSYYSRTTSDTYGIGCSQDN
jgi:hypothetical protein